jgi:hypothetical protein
MIKVPESCLPLLREHRTHYAGDFVAAYNAELQATYEGIKNYLPSEGIILDIGAGMAGIDILLDRHYGGEAKITLLDKQGKAEKINAGFHKTADTFSHYHDFGLAIEMLGANGVENVRTVDIANEKFPRSPFTVVISLLSWGFHYPINTYSPRVKKGGIIIADIRRDTDGIKQLAEYGAITVVHNAKKYQRVVVQC